MSSLQVNDGPERFETKIKAGGVMDVVERYSWSGAVTEHKRRDKRRGIHSGRVLKTETGPQIRYRPSFTMAEAAFDTF